MIAAACRNLILAGVALSLGVAAGKADDHQARTRQAIEKVLPVIALGAEGSARERSCFTCHNQGLPVQVFVEARTLGFDIDQGDIDAQVDHTTRHLARGKSNYLEGRGQGGKADTAGMALWTLHAGKHPPSDLTDAVVHFLLEWKRKSPHWSPQTDRPPSEGSLFTSTYLALLGLDRYGRDLHRDRIAARQGAALKWLQDTEPEETEDAVFLLRTLCLLDADSGAIESVATDLLGLQREDGGWGQRPDLESEAYSTGSALAALHDCGPNIRDSEEWRKGIRFLLDSQLDDGSWHVKSRSRPIQKHYESGFPHEKDQFISSSGTCWAALALLKEYEGRSVKP